MNVFNRREVWLTRQMPELARATDALLASGIPYTVKTNSPTNPGRSHGVPFINADAAYEYRVYVHKKHYDSAKHAILTAR